MIKVFKTKTSSNEKLINIELDVWQAFKEGDRNSLKTIYNQLTPFLFNYGCHLCKDEELVKDVIQDFFINIWAKRERLPEITSIKSYLTIAFKRKIIDALRKKSSIQKREMEHRKDFSLCSSMEQEVVFLNKEEELAYYLKVLMTCLTNRQREAIFLRFYLGFNNTKLAEIMNISVPAVYNIISKSIEALRMNVKLEKKLDYFK